MKVDFSNAQTPARRPSRVPAVLSFLLVGALSLAAFRVALLLSFGDLAVASGVDLARVAFTGLRFDLKILALIALLVWLGIGVVALIRRVLRRPQPDTVTPGGRSFAAAFALLDLLSLSQHYYFGFYRSTFNTIVFGLAEDDTVAVLKTIWQTYPVLWMLAGIALAVWVQTKLWRGLARWLARGRWWFVRGVRPVAALFCLLLLALLVRGSLGTFPLRMDDIQVTRNPLLNETIKNAPFALSMAWFDRRDQVHIGRESLDAGVKAMGFSSIAQVAAALGRPFDPAQPAAFLWQKVPERSLARKPNVAFFLLESWSGPLLNYQAPDNDLVGALAPHLQSDVLLRRFVSAQIGTHSSLEALMFDSPLSPLTLGDYGAIQFPSAASRPFKEQGYKTVFLYGGSGAWRSVSKVMRRQYFDEVYDSVDVMAANPAATSNTWGVYDEFLFDFAFRLMQDADKRGEPIFLFILSTSNHPPHAVPPTYQPKPINWDRMAPIAAHPREESMKMLLTYQYSNDKLGQFINHVKQDPMAAHTVVAATGDHNLRAFFNSRLPADLFQVHNVPAYFYVPPGLSTGRPQSGFASHRDLFPTLYHLALPGARYVALGNDLFVKVPDEERFGLVNNNILFAEDGVVTPIDARWQAFAWNADGTVGADAAPPERLRAQLQRARAVLAAQDWLTRSQVLDAAASAKPSR